MRKIDLNSEREFENSKMLDDEIRSDQDKFYIATEKNVKLHKVQTLYAIQNKRVLEVGCSSGQDAVEYAPACTSYVGIDISDVAIALAKDKKISNAEFLCTDGHKLPFGDSLFDCVIVNSLLHHLDLKFALNEIHRVLAPEGRLILREPLGINPVFSLYRAKTPTARTVDEAPFTRKDLRLLSNYFDTSSLNWFGLFELCNAFIKNEAVGWITFNLDRLISRTPLRLFMWQISGVVQKRKK